MFVKCPGNTSQLALGVRQFRNCPFSEPALLFFAERHSLNLQPWWAEMVTYPWHGKLPLVRDGKLPLITFHTFLLNVKLLLLHGADGSDTDALKMPVLGRV